MGYRPPPPPVFPANTPMVTFGPSDFFASIAEWVRSWFKSAPYPARFDDGYVPDRPWMEGRDS